MPRRRIQRTSDEEEDYQNHRRLQNAEYQRRRRQIARDEQISINRNMRVIQNEDNLGEMNILCKHCKAQHFKSEKIKNKGLSFSDCCSHGAVKLESLPTLPSELLSIFNGDHPKSEQFFNRIRSYNSSLSFASFNANLINLRSRRPGPFCFKIQGQIYYQINTALYPSINDNPSYGQLFIIDPTEAINYRMNQNPEMNIELINILDKIIRDNNIFAQSYEMMNQEILNQPSFLSNNNQEPELQLLFSLKPGFDKKRYNFQRTNEVAAVFSTTADGEIPESYVTIRNRSTKSLAYVSTMDPNVEPWIYPLFYPYGTQGWNREIWRINPDTNENLNRRVTRSDYTKFRMAIRPNEFNVFIRGRRLFQQWTVDSYVKVEKDRIQYCKNNQKDLKADTYQGLHDFMQNSAINTNGQVGKTIILPSTFIGSPRHMQQTYQDAMAIVHEKGKPDIFLTMTCNPKWLEIQENLLPGQQACDRPDIVARVFNLKKNRLIELITKKNFFGIVASYIYVIEFQKRGLPHMHLLITLGNAYKISTPDITNKYISAEIPDAAENAKLHEIVLKNMIHGPCGDWCLENGKCSKHFPKNFQEETSMDENGYPNYRRKNNNKTYNLPNGHTVDNRWVVPYCPTLLEIFNCHINVEAVSTIRSVKYLYKYVYKGHDAAAITITDGNNDETTINHDEIHDFIETRYVSPIEAAHRILKKPLQDKSHSVVRLPVHLPNEHSIIITDDFDLNLENLDQSSSMLLDYFKLNAKDENARQYYYKDIPRYFTHKKNKRTGETSWEPRQSHFNTIGRMYSVSPTQTELFHERLLLLHIRGSINFDCLKTIDNIQYTSFTEACLALGLIEDDNEWEKAMEEAALWMMPRRLRQLFVRILIHCQPIHPEVLWNKFQNSLSEDFSRQHELTISYKIAYAEINKLLMNEGKSLANFPSMDQNVDYDLVIENNTLSFDQMSNEGRRQYTLLNDQQKEIVDIVLNTARSNIFSAQNCMFIDGPGGSGKTFIYTTLYNILSSENIQVCCMAFTGIAATLLPNGKTVHKTFGLPVPMFHDSSSSIKAQSKEGQYLRKTKVFIWDEAPMSPRYSLEIMNRTLQHIMNNSLPFGGKIIILGGDFRQLLPIKLKGTRSETLNLSIKYSELWKNFTMYKLTRNMRVLPNEIDFAKFLLTVGDGTINDRLDNINLPNNCILPHNTKLAKHVFGKLIEEKKFDEMCNHVILASRNVDVNELNEEVTNLLDPSSEHIFTSIDSTENCNNDDLDEVLLLEYLNTLNPSSLPPYKLRLRKYCIVMLIRNISISEGLCNGTRLQVLDFSNHLLKCKVLTGDKKGEIVFLNRITLYCQNEYPFTFKRRQFPVKLAFAMTINKSQGQTFEKVAIDLRRDVFNHGQLYVAMSRVRSWDSVKIFLGSQRTNLTIKNIVYKELYL